LTAILPEAGKKKKEQIKIQTGGGAKEIEAKKRNSLYTIL
jgi:hypothetical protein